ncbi:P-loop containing nucleoside triphosphate hydrolase protein [Irpex rosettiformis]|uniref:P-loop containing nucleoside triphosphate hydrolase protein n=1 Tax=Irpex rosettiformis TaxID=378272 RepID=A0ACB8TYZ7_9APHY|nr:P-loop containing nucleoside triphosphate hydrolase protein [Irpex rosettiformis]
MTQINLKNPAKRSADNAKVKTKAKKRYLKAKKERRKQRKTSHTVLNQEPSSELDAEETQEVVNPISPLAGRTSHEETKLDEGPAHERPRKRRKVGINEAYSDVEESPAKEATLREERNFADTLSTAEGALPIFPLPKRPDAPSRSVLALQGQDKALIEAELVDPRKTTSLEGIGLGERTRKQLKGLGIQELFAVQTAVIPFLLSDKTQHSLYLPHAPPRDLCVSAPTGSGKTLAYVVPIVEILTTRVVTRLRALIVLPTRDLVTQVRETFEEVAKGRGLKIGTATGQHSFAHEQAQLIADKSASLQGGSSKVDILICTPGRLMDHLNSSPNFSLQHLRFLVVDEADRLLAQSFQDWLAQVLAATRPTPPIGETVDVRAPNALPTPDALAPAFLHLLRNVPQIHTSHNEKKEPSCQKLLFSATLPRDPAKIVALNLREPKYLIVQDSVKGSTEDADEAIMDVVMERFTMPASLKEHMIVCETSQKPLILFYLIHTHGVRNAIIFTKSAESTTRLVQLFQFFESSRLSSQTSPEDEGKVVIQPYSSDLNPSDRKTVLEKFKRQEIHILVCSDLISRGIDITHVSHVISYDAPVDMRKYVHRVGRTARAGREGHAWTLVEDQEARHFKSMMREAGHLDTIKRMRVHEKDLSPLTPHYETALESLKHVYVRS